MNDKANQKPADGGNKQDAREARTSSVPATRVAQSSSRDSGLLSRLSGRFNTTLQNNRGGGSTSMPVSAPPLVQRPVEDISLARSRASKAQKMYIPEGVVIEGSISGGSETEIHGRVEGNVSVDATLFLGKNAVVTGTVRAGSCQVEGTVQGGIACTDDLIVTSTGRLASDAEAGKQVRVAGNVDGNVNTPGVLRIEAGGVVNGDVQARVFSMSEGAELNGRCSMRAPGQQETLFPSSNKGENK